ncbi:hypothetical protein A2U01_0028054 [Trifolium medium]|uniref:Uncharacterized protein n=1 Tax=Trifolium medium TaxID=97028 RepID=A0A392P4K3_9FABA|nr:hypothetical protein [Trifolium medium]
MHCFKVVHYFEATPIFLGITPYHASFDKLGMDGYKDEAEREVQSVKYGVDSNICGSLPDAYATHGYFASLDSGKSMAIDVYNYLALMLCVSPPLHVIYHQGCI